MMGPRLPEDKICFGCGACNNVCPKQAITMGYSTKGFLVPIIDEALCVNCGKCERACPALFPQFGNFKEPDLYAFCANDEVRKESTSGGMFTLLALRTLKRGGKVCGAVYDDNMQLHHLVTDDIELVKKMRGSKYLQSDTEDCFKTIKQFLDSGTEVLFTGTPCQVAGLKGSLGKKYDNLVTADLLCHGAPSQMFFNAYIREMEAQRNSKVTNVEFRSKRFGWKWANILTSFSDGTERIGDKTDPYKVGFSGKLMCRETCYNCKFSDYPRQGDITIGDLWESAKIDPESNDKKGTSLVFVNSEKGREVFADIARDGIYCNQISMTSEQYGLIPNRVQPHMYRHPNRDRFLALVREKAFSKAIEQAVKDHFDIGLPTVLFGPNSGSVLTYFALYRVLREMGYSVLPYIQPKTAKKEINQKAIDFCARWLPAYAQPRQYKTISDMYLLNQKCDMFVVGSDQIFLESMSHSMDDFFFLQYTEITKPKIAYASSFGGPGARGTDRYYEQLKYYLNRFTMVTCRENDGVSFANNKLKLHSKVRWVLDPVFLCDESIWHTMIESAAFENEQPYIGAYYLKKQPENFRLLREVKKELGFDSVRCMGRVRGAEELKEFNCDCMDTFPIEDNLALIQNSSFFVTDSFHGVCFALILEKDFLVIPRDFSDRFTSILGRLNLESRIIKRDFSNFTKEALQPIDWKLVKQSLQDLKTQSMDLLRNSLKELGGGKILDYEALRSQKRDYEKEIEQLRKKLKERDEKIKALENRTVIERLYRKIRTRYRK